MRLIITADAHGNDVAYNEVIKNVISKYGNNIDKFIDLGDFTCDFLWGEEIARTMINLKKENKFLGITGNRETGMVFPYYNKKKTGEAINWDINSSMGAPLLSCNRMSDKTLEFITNLPETLLIKFVKPGTNYKNTKNTTYIETGTEPLPTPIYLKHKMPLTDEEKELLKKENCTTILTAHTHIVNNNIYNEYNVFNPGSVGLTSDGVPGASYGELFFKNKHWNFVTNHIDYNYDEIKEKVNANPLLFEKCKNWGTALNAAVDSGVNVPAMYMFEKNRIIQEIAKGTNQITLDPNNNVVINSMGRKTADIGPNGEALKERVFYFDNEKNIEFKDVNFNLDESKIVNTSNIKVTDEIFEQALNNVLYYIDEAKKNFTIQGETIKGRLSK